MTTTARRLSHWFWNRLAEATGYGQCQRCRRPWNVAEMHTVYYELGRGQGAICEECWSQTTPSERVSWYRHFFAEAESRGNDWGTRKAKILIAVERAD